MSRSKPNCFTYVHPIDKRVQLYDYDPRQQLNTFKEAATQFNLSRGESDAVENLLLHISPASREMLTKMSSTFGMVRGPITHSGIASKALRNNFHRESGIAFYQDKLGNAEGTVELILSRVHKDYINTAVGMRASASDDRIQQLQKICRMFQLFLELLETKLSEEASCHFVFMAERPNLVESFMSGSFDDELLEQADKLPVPLDCAALPEFRHLTQRAANQLRSEELRKKKELQAQVDKASIQSLTEQVTQDVEALKVYDKSLAEAKELWGDMVQSYKRNRLNKGLTRVDEIMNTRLSVQTLEVGGPNGGFKSIPRHYNLFKSGAAKDMDLKDIVDADTETICVIDLAFKTLPLPSIQEMIKAASDICHQSCQNCLLIRLPTKTKATTMTAHLNLTRKIEDALLANSLNPEYHMTAVFDVASLHGGDSREGVARFRLCLSENYDGSPWLTSFVSKNHWTVEKVPLVSHKDMRLVPHADAQEQSDEIGVIVVDPAPGYGDVVDAVWALNQAWEKGADVPLFIGINFYWPGNDSEKSKAAGMTSYVKGLLMRTWWETCQEAGDAEPKRTDATTVHRPTLQVLTWDGMKAVVPDMVTERFRDAEDDVRSEWTVLCKNVQDETPKPRTLTPKLLNPEP
ncbi:unnamed protein product [Symbiodinium sp. CCMP2456]|nr:unnamed protein product [Symbiodinium sp. CCMP2456]